MEEIQEIFQRMQQQAKKGCAVTKCKYCKDTGYEYDKETNTAIKCRCGLLEMRALNNRFKFAEIPKSFQNMNFKDFDANVYKLEKSRKKARSAVKALQYWIDNYDVISKKGIGLYLYSDCKGSGKTRAVASIASELIRKGVNVKFATSIQIINEIKATWDKKERADENKLLDFLSIADVLVIDDFGTEKIKDWIEERFYHVINQRYIDSKPTLFTSNYRLADLPYNDRITNRIKERTYQIPFPEESVRDIIAERNMQELIAGVNRTT